MGLDGRAFVCPNRHSFDLAREGYVNLLLANQKGSPEPGDSVEMVRSRRRFLDLGHYEPLAELLTEIVAELSEVMTGRQLEVLDSGCGEGYLLARLSESLSRRGVSGRLRGIDVSRPAVRAAAMRDRALCLAVASVHQLPLGDGSLDLVLRVLAPADASEFRRVLSPRGHLITVTPGPDHLLALRQLVYESPRSRSAEPPPEGFSLVRAERLAFPLRLTSAEERRDLLGMTPYLWHASQEAREVVVGGESLETTADFALSVYAQEPEF